MEIKNTAAIVETRVINNIADIINQHMLHLPNWELFVFHGTSNKHLFEQFKNKIDIGSLDINGYNHLLTSTAFWEYFSSEKILIFQHDSMLLRQGINEFLRWDYIGAPIPHGQDQNGGLSLRTKSVMIEVIKQHRYQYPFEDTYFSRHVPLVGGKKAPIDIASKFSFEMTFKTGTLGYHAIHRYFSPAQCTFIKNQYNPSLFQGLR